MSSGLSQCSRESDRNVMQNSWPELWAADGVEQSGN